MGENMAVNNIGWDMEEWPRGNEKLDEAGRGTMEDGRMEEG
jgi:hypothetical protein